MKIPFVCSRLFIGIATLILLTGSSISTVQAQDSELPFNVFGDYVDSEDIYRYFAGKGIEMLALQPEDFLENLRANLEVAPDSYRQSWRKLVCFRPAVAEQLHKHMVKSSVMFGELYDCGRCDQTHANVAGGVIVSEDGIVLTNYHVLEPRKRNANGKTEGYMVMTYDGKAFKIDTVLAASKKNDIAVVQLDANGHRFHAAPIADVRPLPGSSVRVMSNPSNQFYVMTSGEVSRYSRNRDTKNRRERVVRMEITADFAAGSSGSGVFNADGEVVGLVSRIDPVFRSISVRTAEAEKGKATQRYAEMIFRRCVPLDAIHACFKD